MDDYYELLGVDKDAATGDIRTAYREKKAALDNKGDKTEIARVNKAWNVLSDPYQRGRYDEQLAPATDETDADDELEDATVSASVSGSEAGPPPRRRLFEPRPRRDRAAMQPTIELPPGATLAQQRPRIMAMVTDVVVMIVLLFAVQTLVGDRVVERWYPEEHAALSSLTDDPPGDTKSPLEEAKDASDEADDEADDLENDQGENDPEARAARADADEKKQAYDDMSDEFADLQRDVWPAGIVVLEGIIILCVAYLVIPSALTGQTLGKRFQKLRVIRQDGSPLGWGGALVRYGSILLAVNLLLLIGSFGTILIAGLFIIVLGWMRNPNRLAMQDKVAKTIVVDA